jgi:peptide deformylase
MAIRNIRKIGDSVLYKVSKEIKEVDQKLNVLIDDMIETMYDAEGVGLAAPQVGVLKRLVVIDVSEEGNDPIVLINPVILETEGEQTGDEGCLSVPGKVGTVTRPNYVKVKAYDRNMKEFIIEGTELLARALSHEIDHLDGKLYVDQTIGELRSVMGPEEE